MRPTLLLAALLALSTPSFACGQRVHVEIARRAIERFLAEASEVLPGIDRLFDSDEVRVAFYCGSMFPDWGYDGVDPEAGEHGHWRAFQEALFDVVKPRLAAEWTREDRLRVAFFLGVVSHGIADNPWHFSSRDRPSFLAEARARDGASHGQTEFAGDLFLHAERERRIALDHDHLYWPVDDVLDAIRASGGSTTRERIHAGCLRLETTWHAAALAAPAAAGFLRDRYPWVALHLEDHAFGGIDHGAAATAVWALHYLARFRGAWLFQDTPRYGRSNAEHCYGYAGCADGDLETIELGGERRLEIGFDVSAVLAGTRVGRATLWLHAQGGATEAEVRVEAGSSVLATATAGPGPRWVAWDVTPAARSWIDASRDDRGLVLSAPGTNDVLRFDGSAAFGETGARVAYRPILVVEPARR